MQLQLYQHQHQHHDLEVNLKYTPHLALYLYTIHQPLSTTTPTHNNHSITPKKKKLTLLQKLTLLWRKKNCLHWPLHPLPFFRVISEQNCDQNRKWNFLILLHFYSFENYALLESLIADLRNWKMRTYQNPRFLHVPIPLNPRFSSITSYAGWTSFQNLENVISSTGNEEGRGAVRLCASNTSFVIICYRYIFKNKQIKNMFMM